MIRWLLRLIAALAALGALAAFGLHYIAKTPLKLSRESVQVDLKPRSGVRSIARQLAAAGVPVSDWQFELLARLSGKAGGMKAGTYQIPDNITPLALIEKLNRGEFVQAEVKLIEGWTFKQFRKALADSPDLRPETANLSDAEVLRAVGATEPHPEGLFFPDTYAFARGTTDIVVLKLAYNAMRKHLNTAWESRAPEVTLKSPYEALILASIIEKETGRPDERGQVGAVFANRMRINMRLQTDPTIIYGLGDSFDGNIRKRDLTTDGPYNTYTRAGLPPTPIAMPGRAAIEAAVRPPSTEALYFVARGDGSSYFSKTLDEHNRAVARYQLRGGK
jgi:UPF0755 protein